jgi:hypothetical protein
MLPIRGITIFASRNAKKPGLKSALQSEASNKATRVALNTASPRTQKARFSKREFERLCYGGKVQKNGYTYWSLGAQFDRGAADAEMMKYIRLARDELMRVHRRIKKMGKEY